MAINSINYSSTLRFSGLATGLDTDNIVKELMNAHRIPLVRLQQQRQLLEWQQEAYRELNRLFDNFKNAVSPLRFESTFQVKTANVNNTSVANVTASNQVTDGLYTLNVKALAKGASLTSEKTEYKDSNAKLNFDFDKVQKIYINGAEIELEADMTAGAFVAAVNAKSSETGVKVSFDSATQRFFFTTVHSGETHDGKEVKIDFFDFEEEIDEENYVDFWKNAIGIDDNSLDAMASGVLNDQLKGQNAVVEYQGTEMEFTSNTFSINGLSIQLKGTGEVNITVSQNVEAIFNAIKKFVEEYNKLVDEVNKKLQEPRYRDYAPLTQEQKDEMTEKEIELWEARAKSGLIRNDSMLTGILSQLRMAISSVVESSAFKNLSAVFIETGPYYERGKLYITKEDELRNLISQNPEEIMKLFVVNDPNDESKFGIGKRVYDIVDNATKQLQKKAGSMTGYSLVDNSTLGEQIKDIDKRIERMQTRLIAIEQRYWAQFTALERAVARMNMQSAWLAQTFGGGA